MRISVALAALRYTYEHPEYKILGIDTQSRVIETNDVTSSIAIEDYLNTLCLEVFPETEYSNHAISYVEIPK